MKKKTPLIGSDFLPNQIFTCTDWFMGPDGNQYNNIWGSAKVMKAVDLIGFEPTHSTNWALVFKNGTIIQGCRIHYSIPCEKMPANKNVFNGNV